MAKNTMLTALLKHLKDFFKRDLRINKSKNTKNNKMLFKIKNNIKKDKKTKKESKKNNFRFVGILKRIEKTSREVRIPNKLYYMISLFCFLFILVTSIVSIVQLTSEKDTKAIYKYDELQYNSSTYSNVLGTNTNKNLYNGILGNGDIDFVQSNNVTATNTVETDVYVVRNHQEQYDFLKVNKKDILLAWIIKRNLKYLFPKYYEEEINSILEIIQEYLYQELLQAFLVSNATNFTNFIRSFGYEGRDDYRLRVILPRSYIYFYLVIRMVEIDENDPKLGSFNAIKVLKENVFKKVWGLKLAKNYARFENSLDIYCNNLDSITTKNGPSQEQWNRIGSCKFLNGDAIFGKKTLGNDINNGKRYIGYLGIMGRTDRDWYRFCDFISAQLCEDTNYSPDNYLLQTPFNLFLNALSPNSNNDGFFFDKLNNLGIETNNDEDTLLIPFENSYVILRLNRIEVGNLVGINTKKLLANNSAGIQALVAFLKNSFKSFEYNVFCQNVVDKDFSLSSISSKLDVELSIYDSYSISIFTDLCSKGIIS